MLVIQRENLFAIYIMSATSFSIDDFNEELPVAEMTSPLTPELLYTFFIINYTELALLSEVVLETIASTSA